jgi:hypothetical protein
MAPKTVPVHSTATEQLLPQRQLGYSLLVQRMRNHRPYQQVFQATGREI